MTKFKFFFLFFFLGLTQSFAQSVPGIISDRVSKLDAMLDEAIKNQQVPGLVAMILKDGKVVYHEAKGFADVPSNRLMKKDDIFRIASQTKAITSTAVMMLWEEGKFRLDDPISMYIPEFKNPQVLSNFRYADTSYTTKPSSKEITIRHLLTHTSGLGYGVIDGDERMRMIYSKAGITDLFTTKNISIEESVKKLAKLPLHHEPGSKYTYSEGLDVLGYFIEVVSGMPFDRFLQERIFDPLGMKDTRFYLSDIQAPRLVTVHTFNQGKWNPYPVTFYDPEYPRKGAKRFFSGGAGLSSTTADYAKFLQMYLNGGVLNGKRILSSHTIETMMKNQVGDLWNGDKFYGLAFGVVTEQGVATGGLGSEGTFDWGGYFNTQYFADPQENIIGLIFKQTSGAGNGDQTGWKFRQMVFTLIE
ncbi:MULTISPECIES: serine hydrolase domain-containing protein [unclassified Algoriphagus]|jgi:CubicO group peptidase (beta-lactamase class C family)|uniref:serine hydrolase domain-containing protein n=1 Tax=unclassified Algoriphagus TaxID=2641541 RepID=UPI00257E7801|nr:MULTISPECIES: serine hydrolase domain-containing protein [unclassified Algoriphagus]|tara:strand:- start:6435 stop:7682 length:1248 start_codon:yes stop_codon:yes gene_type:complete